MRLTVYNGSPRGKMGNTELMISHVIRGIRQSGGGEVETYHLKAPADLEGPVQAFQEAELVLLALPLYTDAVPGTVKALIEALAPYRGRPGKPHLCFLVQGGFPEAIHTHYLARYLEKPAARLGCPFAGCIRKGGAERLRQDPEGKGRKLLALLADLGHSLAREGRFDQALCRRLALPHRLPPRPGGSSRASEPWASWTGCGTGSSRPMVPMRTGAPPPMLAGRYKEYSQGCIFPIQSLDTMYTATCCPAVSLGKERSGRCPWNHMNRARGCPRRSTTRPGPFPP